MLRKEPTKASGSPKVEIGEIDTRAPFHSVKDAVTLFGKGTLSGEKPTMRKAKPHSAERVLATETQLHLSEKELKKLKEQLKNAENTKAEALVELEKAKKTFEEFTLKLKAINESKEAAFRAAEAVKGQGKLLREANSDSIFANNVDQTSELVQSKQQYTSALEELSAVKKELLKIRHDFDASLEAKNKASKQVQAAAKATEENSKRAQELSEELSALKEAIEQVRSAYIQAKEQQVKVFEEKVVDRESYKVRLEETEKKLGMITKEFNPEMSKKLEAELAEKMREIQTMQKEMENAKASDLETIKSVTSELDEAKEFLQKVLGEESSLQGLVDSLKLELEKLRKEHSELRQKEAETESLAGSLHVQLRKCKSELEMWLGEEAKSKGAWEEMVSTLCQLSSETKNAQLEAEEMRFKSEELVKEAGIARASLEEAERQLKITLQEAEEAESSEKSALDQIKDLVEQTSNARSSSSESDAKITISRDEFEFLKCRAEQLEKLAGLKVEAAMAQVEAVRASEIEALQRLELVRKEIEDTSVATEDALKRAKMAEEAKKAVEGELRRWREREQKKAAETASRILAETQSQSKSQPTVNMDTEMTSYQNPPAKHSPVHYKVQKHKSEKTTGLSKKLEKQRTSVSKKVLVPNLTSLFHRKKSQIKGETASYLPGERPF